MTSKNRDETPAQPRRNRLAYRPNLNTSGITAHDLKRSGAPDYSRAAERYSAGVELRDCRFHINTASALAVYDGRRPKHPLAAVIGEFVSETQAVPSGWTRVHYDPRKRPDAYTDDAGVIVSRADRVILLGRQAWAQGVERREPIATLRLAI